MKNSEIAWCDNTFNPWEGCTKVSEGCKNCYALARDERFTGGIHWGKGAPRRRTSAANWKQPLKWNRVGCGDCDCCIAGQRCNIVYHPRVFCASLADWLDDEVPIEWLADLLKLIHDTPNLDWLLLTKRPENWEWRLHEAFDPIFVNSWLDGKFPSNVWIGTTVENQQAADLRIPQLLKIPARIRFLSVEPMLEKINLGLYEWEQTIHWCIVGGESGPKARQFDPAWAEDIRQQCAFSDVAFFAKQMGQATNPKTFRDFNSFPASLKVRQFPA
jgi:protein gp37